ncbi:MAG: GNAT family N-acetyltransferase [Flavobacterium sp.]|nr:MAG: GNAT family N-acetyltransferase [Flavobacterium sp.]
MQDYAITLYESRHYDDWNAFAAQAKNATFLFHRDFMEYHSDRFYDYSLMVFDGEKLMAILPAHRKDAVVYSHLGLTYGGLVYDERIKQTEVILIFKSVLQFLDTDGIGTLHIKTMPSIYHLKPADELGYALFLTDAKLVRRDSLSVIDITKPYFISKTRRESIRRGEKNGLIIREEPNFRLFWEEILIPNLSKKHGVKPVHSIEEIEKLHRFFPENIRHFNVYHNEKIVAGTTVFVSQQVAHPQYISGQGEKNELGSLDYLYHYLITDVFKDKHFFDFGISNEQQGRKLNSGLIFWKESFGASTIAHDFYEVPTANHKLLADAII